jgi:serine/threonine protein kinase
MIMRRGVRNRDVKPRNTLIFQSGFHGKFKVVMIDFGACVIRTTESDRDWRAEEAYEDQEGAVGQLMEHLLNEHRGGGYEYRQTAYKDQLEWDFMREFGSRI